MAPHMLIVQRLMELLKYLYNIIITRLLKIPPVILNINAAMVPLNIDPRRVLKIITIKASLQPKSIKAARETVFESPNFIPGNINNTGIWASTIYSTKAIPVKKLKKTNFFVLFIFSP